MKKISILDIQRFKHEGRKIAMLTAYDVQISRILDACGVDMILVGDSVGNVVLGYDNTLPVSMDDMVRHTQAVVRGRNRAFVVADMPFMSYQASTQDALNNAGRLIKEAGAEAVKVEGGSNAAPAIRAIAHADIPVMAHIGLTPQSVHRMGGFRVQGRDEQQRQKLLADAMAVEEAGAFSVVLECIPADLAAEITQRLRIPTIGIGAGSACDGQVLVINDVLGLCGPFRPKFVKQYVQLEDIIGKAVGDYIDEVRGGMFPGDEYAMK
jgi:3-methyl-2-oxobutanoate hydroxymethyltransferase